MEMDNTIVVAVTNDLTYDQRMMKTCTFLSQHYHRVLLLGRQLPASIPLSNAPFQQKRWRLLFTKGPLFYVEYNLRLWLFLLQHKPSHVVSVDTDTLLACGIYKWLYRSKVTLFFDAHEYFSQVPELLGRKKIQWIWEKISTTFIPLADKAYTVGPMLSDIFTVKYKKTFDVVMNAPLFEENSMSHDGHISLYEQEKWIIYQGALNEGRGIEHMITAMDELRNEALRFHIVGDGPIKSKLEEMIRVMDLSSTVKLLGFMKPEDLQSYSKRAYLSLNVSENKGWSYYYSLNNKFFDYIHAGVPSLLNNFPEYVALNQIYDVGILCEASPSSLVHAVKTILLDNDRYCCLKNNCLHAAKKLSWQNEMVTLQRIYGGS
jgi:glycosyltransferase involved in cell wall biosynthesis